MSNKPTYFLRRLAALAGPLFGWLIGLLISSLLINICYDIYYALGFPGTGLRPWTEAKLYLGAAIYGFLFVAFGALFLEVEYRKKVADWLFLTGFIFVIYLSLISSIDLSSPFLIPPTIGGLVGLVAVYWFSNENLKLSFPEFKTDKYILIGLGLICTATAVASLKIMFEAGCAGDIKNTGRGDILLALQLEQIGISLMFLSSICGGIAVSLMLQTKARIAYGLAFAIFILTSLWYLGIHFENSGVIWTFA